MMLGVDALCIFIGLSIKRYYCTERIEKPHAILQRIKQKRVE